MKRAKAVPCHSPEKRITVLVPARNEECVIHEAASSLMVQDYSRKPYDVIVLTNNCTDETAARAAAARARVMIPGIPVHKKSDVLRYPAEVGEHHNLRQGAARQLVPIANGKPSRAAVFRSAQTELPMNY